MVHDTDYNTPIPSFKHLKLYEPGEIYALLKEGKSIDLRPEEVNTREEFGHWEIDTKKAYG